MDNLLYIGILCLIITIGAVLIALISIRKDKKAKHSYSNIPVANANIEKAASEFPNEINYSKVEKRVSYKRDINSLVKEYTHFYSKFNIDHEEAIIMAKALLDNKHFLKKPLNQLNSHKNDKYKLPVEKNKNSCIINTLAKEIVKVTGYEINEERVIRFINSYQKIRELKYKELCLMIPMLQLELLKELANQIEYAMITSKKYDDCEKMIRSLEKSHEFSPEIGRRIRKYIHTNADEALAKLYIDILDSTLVKDEVVKEIVDACEENNIDIKEIVEKQQQRLATKAVIVDKIIGSLWAIEAINWDELLQKISFVEMTLRDDEDDIYVDMTEKTKEYYRKKIAKLASKLQTSEKEVAETAKEIAIHNKCHVGEVILGEHEFELIQTLGGKFSPKKSYSFGMFKFVILVLTVLGVALYAFIAYLSLNNLTYSLILGALILIPTYLLCSDITKSLYNRLIPEKIVPMLNFEEGIPKEAKTLVVVPVLGISEEQLNKVLNNVDLIAHNNGKENIVYALLIDFPESYEKDEEKKIMESINDELDKLNKNYETEYMFALVRNKEYDPVTKKHLGKERKRGAVLMLNEYLQEGYSKNFAKMVLPENLKNVQYVITLDEDTMLLPNEVSNMAGSLHHPLNRPVVKNGRLIKGVSIMQPKIRTKLGGASKNRFTYLYSGAKGYSRYSTNSNGVFLRAFNTGFFYGKGIYQPRAFNILLKNRFRDNTILSHDIVEGGFAGAKECEATAIEGFPENVFAYYKRQERWVRGDWQLLPYILPFVRNKENKLIRNEINKVTKHQILENTLQGITSLFVLLSLLVATYFNCIQIFMLFVVLPYLIKMLLKVIRDFFVYGKTTEDTLRYSEKKVLDFCMMPYKAYVETGAALRAVFRMLFARKNLLQWSTAAQSKNKENTLGRYFVKFFPNLIMVAIFAIFSVIDVSHIIYTIPIAQIYLFSIFLIYTSNGIYEYEEKELEADDLNFLKQLLRKSYRYFEDFTSEESGLIADNYQKYECIGCANRTSPTNIGMSFMVNIIALEEEYISHNKFINKIHLTLTTLEKMEKHKGHIYNWYDSKTAQPIGNRYISSVDNGNLKVALRVLEEYLKQKEITDLNVQQRCKIFADEMDFEFLYNKRRKLFYIGYDNERKEFCNSHYDMLMSEARQMSFLEVAENTIPVSHWNTLSRQENCTKTPVMMSWGGSTFEYFMPFIFFDIHKNTAEYETYKNYIKTQKKYCSKKSIPFGISESAYYDFDTSLNYQYKSFGVPSTGNKRGLAAESVCSPYSAALIIQIDPELAIAALKDYEDLGMASTYGLYEAVDFTNERLKRNQEYEVVKSYMAHHQGMLLCSIYNYLAKDFFKDLFMNIKNVAGCKELLNEPVLPPCVNSNKNIDFVDKTYRPLALSSIIGVYKKKNEGKFVHCHNMSNFHYNMNIDSRGCGVSTYNGHIINGLSGGLSTEGGIFAFAQEEDKVYPFTYDNKAVEPKDYRCAININSVEFNSTYEDLILSSMVYVSQYENMEIRRYTIDNTVDKRRTVKLYIYSDVALCKKNNYIASRAFQNLFITSKVEGGTLFFERRKHHDTDDGIAMSWKVITDDDFCVAEFGNDAEKLLGRYRQLSDALMFSNPITMSESTICPAAIACVKVTLSPRQKKDIYLVQACGESQEDCQIALDAAYTVQQIQNDYDLSYAKIKSAYKFEGLTNKHIILINKMLPMILYPKDLFNISHNAIESNVKKTRDLWRLGISGDFPIVYVEVDNYDQTNKVEHMLKIHKHFYYSGVLYDLVLINRDSVVYNNGVQQKLYALRNAYVLNDEELKKRTIILNINDVEHSEILLLKALAKCTFNCSVPFTIQTNSLKYQVKNSNTISEISDQSDLSNLVMFNGFGGYDEKLKEYVIKPSGTKPTPAPWCNVLTNGKTGAVVSEKGITYMWYENSRENPVLPWHNNPVTDECGIKLDILDVTYDKALMNIGNASSKSGAWKVRHGLGYSIFQKDNDDVNVSCSMFVSGQEDCLVQIISISNKHLEDMQVAIDFDANITLGTNKPYTVLHKKMNSGVLSKNYFANELNDEIFYSLVIDDEKEQLVMEDVEYTKSSKQHIVKKFQLFAESSVTVGIIMGIAKDENQVKKIYEVTEVDALIEMFKNNNAFWNDKATPISIETPDAGLNALLNGFLMYQVQSSRLFGRTGYYQCGGAYGFRDQLQDSLAMLYANPNFTREMLINFASHQFLDGDVQHWWHAPARGVRTKIRDDMLFMPYVLSEYVDYTQDDGILDEKIKYLENVEIPEGDDDWYGEAKLSDESGTMLEHCLRAIDRCSEFGVNGLPLMYGGDWNDGMNKVGIEGQGESVWLGFFLYDVLNKMNHLLLRKNQYTLAEEMLEKAIQLKKALNESAWDGKWYKRAFYDDGTSIGSKDSVECKIDCISQAWSVISDVADLERGNMSMDAVIDILYDENNQIVKLLWPPFDKDDHNPGYIKGYLKGVRENGGQYTHGALWALKAFAMLGRGSDVGKILDALNPMNHAKTYDDAIKYKVEPYVMAADIYSADGQQGRGGWTWYTGSGAWMYNVVVKDILGVKIKDGILNINPCINPAWESFKLSFFYKDTKYSISIKNPNNKSTGIKSLLVDAKEVSTKSITMINDGGIHSIYGIM